MSKLSAFGGGGGDATSVVDAVYSGSSRGGFSSSTVAGTASTLYVKRSLSGSSWSKKISVECINQTQEGYISGT